MRSAVLYNFLLEANIMACIAILLMIPLRKFLRKQLGNRALCFGWLLVALRLLCPLALPNPLINGIRSPFAPDAAIRPIAGQVRVRFADLLSDIQTFLMRTNNYRSSPSQQVVLQLQNDMYNARIPILLAKIFLIGMAVVAVWFVIVNLHFRRKLRKDRIEELSGNMLDQYRALCAERRVKPLPVYFVDPLPSACLVGVFHPYIALPLTSLPEEIPTVLTHEICHYQNKDHLWGVLRLLCCVIHWFNPLVWAAAAMCRTDIELRCDDRVVTAMDQACRERYANALLHAASKKKAPGLTVLATGMTMTGKRLKNRVTTIVHHAKPIRFLMILFFLVSSMCLVGAFSTAETQLNPRLTFKTNSINVGMLSPSKAFEQAQEVFRLNGYDQLPYFSNVHWSTIPDDFSGGCLVLAEAEEGIFQVGFSADGEVVSINLIPENSIDCFTDCYEDNGYLLPEKSRQQLADDLIAYVKTIAPSTGNQISTWDVYTMTSFFDDTRYAGYEFYGQEGDYLVTIIVQIQPRVMLVNYVDNLRGGNG